MKRITKFIYFGFASLALACSTVSQTAWAVVPAPNGGYPGGNTAEGTNALFSRYYWCLGHGPSALKRSITPPSVPPNTVLGYKALFNNIGGGSNTAMGANALLKNVSGSFNIAVGHGALANNTGSANTGMGFKALFSNIDGQNNTAGGYQALYANHTGADNAAYG
jgi:hypothetical protein